jgi:hypothetical protein
MMEFGIWNLKSINAFFVKVLQISLKRVLLERFLNRVL